jgi:hypothetical protein
VGNCYRAVARGRSTRPSVLGKGLGRWTLGRGRFGGDGNLPLSKPIKGSKPRSLENAGNLANVG